METYYAFEDPARNRWVDCNIGCVMREVYSLMDGHFRTKAEESAELGPFTRLPHFNWAKIPIAYRFHPEWMRDVHCMMLYKPVCVLNTGFYVPLLENYGWIPAAQISSDNLFQRTANAFNETRRSSDGSPSRVAVALPRGEGESSDSEHSI